MKGLAQKKNDRHCGTAIPRRSFLSADSGSATAEFSLILPAVIVIALLLLSLGRAVLVRVECQDAARAGAQQIATANAADTQIRQKAIAAVHEVSPSAQPTLSDRSDSIAVAVSCPVLPGPLGILPARVSGFAVALRQQAS